jgi:hypothetical protein
LRQAGYRPEDLGIVMRDKQEAAGLAAEAGAGDATTSGAIGGGVLGGLAGLAIGAAALAVPGFGPLLVAGPLATALATALAGGALGAVAGGLVGALVSMGVPEHEARDYQAGVERGGILLTVHVPDDREEEVRDVLDRVGTGDLADGRGRWEQDPGLRPDVNRPAAATAAVAEPVGSDTGSVADAGAGTLTAGGAALGSLTGAVVGATAGGPVGGIVGAVVGGLSGAGVGEAMRFAGVEPEFRAEWEAGPHRDRTTWEQAAGAYRYGWESRDRPEFRSRTWDESHPELQRGWTGPGTWHETQPLVRRGWELRTTHQAQGR